MTSNIVDDKDNEVINLTFEAALNELETILSRLESGNIDLSSSISQYERGEKLRLHCENLLKNAELRVEKLIINKNGEVDGVEDASHLSQSKG